jgi:hypothetical protein
MLCIQDDANEVLTPFSLHSSSMSAHSTPGIDGDQSQPYQQTQAYQQAKVPAAPKTPTSNLMSSQTPVGANGPGASIFNYSNIPSSATGAAQPNTNILLQRMEQLLELNTQIWNKLKDSNGQQMGSMSAWLQPASSQAPQQQANSVTSFLPNAQATHEQFHNTSQTGDTVSSGNGSSTNASATGNVSSSSSAAGNRLRGQSGSEEVAPAGNSFSGTGSASLSSARTLSTSFSFVEKTQSKDHSSSSSSTAASGHEKDKSFGKLAYFLSEMKKEVDSAHKQKKDSQLEMQLLREKYNSLEERLAADAVKISNFEDKIEKGKQLNKQLQAQNDHLQGIIEGQNSIIAQLQQQMQQYQVQYQQQQQQQQHQQQQQQQQQQHQYSHTHVHQSAPHNQAVQFTQAPTSVPQQAPQPQQPPQAQYIAQSVGGGVGSIDPLSASITFPVSGSASSGPASLPTGTGLSGASGGVAAANPTSLLSSNASILADSYPIFSSLGSLPGSGNFPPSSVPVKPSGPAPSNPAVFHSQTTKPPPITSLQPSQAQQAHQPTAPQSTSFAMAASGSQIPVGMQAAPPQQQQAIGSMYGSVGAGGTALTGKDDGGRGSLELRAPQPTKM